MESLRTSLASRTHFEVLGFEGQVLGLGLDLEASSPRKLSCPRLEDSTIFWTVKIFLENAQNLAENMRRTFLYSSFGDSRKKFLKTFFLENTCVCVLGLEHSCSWPREGLSWEGLSLVFASDFFCVLGPKPCVLDSTSGNNFLFTKLPWPGDSERTLRSSSQAATVYNTRWRLHTVPLIDERQAGKL